MRICFITENLAVVGGVQRVLSVVANALAREHSVSILMTSPLQASEKIVFSLEENISVIREESLCGSKTKYLVPYKALRYVNKRILKINNIGIMKWAYFPPKETCAFNHYFTENPYDAVIGVQPRAAALVSALSGSFKKIGWMHSPYDAYFRSPMRFQWRQENMYKEMLPQLDRIVVLTDHDKAQFAEELIGGGVQRRKNLQSA